MVLSFIRLVLFALLFLALQSNFAQDSELTDAELEKQIAEMEQEIEKELMLEYSPWDFSANVRLGGGYKENVTMSAFTEESSEFSLLGFDFMGIRIPMDDSGYEVAIFGAFDDVKCYSIIKKPTSPLGSFPSIIMLSNMSFCHIFSSTLICQIFIFSSYIFSNL